MSDDMVLGASPSTTLYDLMVEGYRFCRSDGVPFDSAVMTFVPPEYSTTITEPPTAVRLKPDFYEDHDMDIRHRCENDSDVNPIKPAFETPFVLAHRCEPTWSVLSDQQKNVIETIEQEVCKYRSDGVYFRSVIIEGLGGCGKTRLMAYVLNHSPNNTHALYLTKQNKRLQDFLYDELERGEIIPPRPILDMTKFKRNDFYRLQESSGGRYACSVEKLVYNVGDYQHARETNSRKALQWKIGVPDTLFASDEVRAKKSNVVVFLDEYTMISPPLLHKMLHCVDMLFSSPTVLIMGGDRYQLGPINWDVDSDKNYLDRSGEKASAYAITSNNTYYLSDVRKELKTRLGQEPFEYEMVGSQRCRDDPELAKMVIYLRNACQKRTSIKAIERRLVEFGRRHGIHLFRYDEFAPRRKTGKLVLQTAEEQLTEKNIVETVTYDQNDEDRHLGDDDLRDTCSIDIDWSSPPTVDMAPFIKFYTELYTLVYENYIQKNELEHNEQSALDLKQSALVFGEASKFAYRSFPCFIVKKNDKCNILSDTFLKTLYNGVHTELVKEHTNRQKTANVSTTTTERGREENAKRAKLSTDCETSLDLRAYLKRLCVSISVSETSPVQQTLMVGVPYRMTHTLKCASEPVLSNGEIVLVTSIIFNEDDTVSGVIVKTLQRRSDNFILAQPGLTQNRLNEMNVKQRAAGSPDDDGDCTFMFPMVAMVCENIYQMQGNTIISDCFVDLLSTKRDDIYVAVSRFQKISSIKGIIMAT